MYDVYLRSDRAYYTNTCHRKTHDLIILLFLRMHHHVFTLAARRPRRHRARDSAPTGLCLLLSPLAQ